MNLEELFWGLDDREAEYVWQRSRTYTDKAAYEAAAIPKGTFYEWPAERRQQLNDLAAKMRRDRLFEAELVLRSNVGQAAQVKVDGLKSRKEHIKQGAATEILDRVIGRPVARMALTDPTGEREYTGLTDEERAARIAALLELARKRKEEETGEGDG